MGWFRQSKTGQMGTNEPSCHSNHHLQMQCRTPRHNSHQSPRTRMNFLNLYCLTTFCCNFKGFLCLKVKFKRFKAINFRWNPADCTRVSKAKKLASPADVTSTLGLRPPFTRPWTRRWQLQTFIYWRGFDGFTQFFFSSSPNYVFFWKTKRKNLGWGAL